LKGCLSLLIACAAAMIASVAQAQMNSWTSIGPNGGRVFRVAYNSSNPSIVYLLSQGGFARSTDGGVTWTMIYTDMSNAPYDMAVDPNNPSNVYVISQTAPYFLVSGDSGKTMQLATQPPVNFNNGIPSVQVSADGRTIFAAAGPAVAASTDRGKTWTVKTGLPYQGILRLFADPRDAATLYAAATFGSGYGLFVSHDGALTWTASYSSSTDMYSYTNDLAIDPSNVSTLWNARGNGLWLSRDRGVTWSLSSYDIRAYAVALDPRNSSIIYASDGRGETLRSSDAGVSWTDVTGNLTTEGSNVIAVSPASGAVLIGGLGGVWGSPSGGANWTEQVQGLPATYIEQFSANPATDRIYMNTEDSLIGYVAGGASGTSLTNRDALKQLSPVPGSFVVSSILAQPGVGGSLFASLIDGIASSADGGESWTLRPLPFSYATEMESMATWPGSQTILISSIAAQYRSTDDGFTWTAVTAGLPQDTQFNKMVTAPSDPNVAYVSVYGAQVPGITPYYDLFKSTDAGLTWQRAGSDWPSNIYQIAVDPFDAQTIYVTNQDSFQKSVTGGKSFAKVPWDTGSQGNLPVRLAIDPVHTQILYAVGARGIFRSVDGGQTWQPLPSSPFSPTYGWGAPEITVDANRTSDVYVGTTKNGAYKLTVAPDLALNVQSAAAQYGSTLTSTYKAVNNGPYDATGVKLVVQLPAGMTQISGTINAGQCTSAVAVLTCTLPIMRTGTTYSVLVNALAPGAGTFASKATVAADQPDSDSSNNSVTTTTAMSGFADLSVSAIGPSSAQAGDAISYTLSISNAGPAVAVAARLSYQSDSDIQMTGVSTTSGSCSLAGAGAVSCDLGNIPASKTVMVTINAIAMTAGVSSATATVTSDNINPDVKSSSAVSGTSISSAPAQTGGAPSSSSTSSSSGNASAQGTASGGGGGAFSAPWLLGLAIVCCFARGLPRRRV
jgi:uncharacterized repeat protein (TIGR01451 family)